MPSINGDWIYRVNDEYIPNYSPRPVEIRPNRHEILYVNQYAGNWYHHAISNADTISTTEFPLLRRASSLSPRRTPSPIIPTQYPSNTASPMSHSEPVDLRSLEYVDEFDHNLLCAICHSAFVLPVKLDCEHVFCQECINQALSHSENCPTCRRQITGRPMGVAVPKIIDRILDGLLVKCPMHLEGCTDAVPRGVIQAHVDQYCDYTEVKCPWDRCTLKARRKDARKNYCTHVMLSCRDCREDIMERDLEHHREELCKLRQAICVYCNTEVSYQNLQSHVDNCPDVSFSCEGAAYGCDFKGKRESLKEHLLTCPLNKLGPFLEGQKTRLQEHEVALTQLRLKNSVMETSLANLVDILSSEPDNTSSTSSWTAQQEYPPLDANACHLLSLHNSLREEVSRVSAALIDLDAKASMMVMNESLRSKDEMALTNAALSSMRMQLHWLTSAKLQNQQRASMTETQASSNNSGPSILRRGVSSSAGTREEIAPAGRPIRRSSDLSRQETKL